MNIQIKNKLRESLIKESININNLPNGKVQFLCINQEGKKVGFALLDLNMDVDKYVSGSYEDPDNDYLDPDLGRHFPQGKAAKFERVYVYPKFRDDKVNRYGAQLINAVKDYCKQNGVNTILLTASPIALKNEAKISPEALVNIYQKYGFQVVKVGAGHDMVAQLEEGAELLSEDLRMHNEIESLASLLYRKLTNKLTERTFQTGSVNFNLPIIINPFDGLYHKFNLLNEFMKEFSLKIQIVDKRAVGFRGRFSVYTIKSGLLEIPMDVDRVKECLTDKVVPYLQDDFTEELSEDVTLDVYFCLHSSQILSTLIHELQHIYDSWRSNSKFTNSKRTHDYHDKYGYEDIKTKEQELEYIKQQHEINARFSQAIQRTNFETFNFDNQAPGMPMDYLILNDFKKVLDTFKRSFFGYEDMPPKVKERLLNRFVKIYYEKEAEIQEKNKELLNKKRG